MGSSSAASAAGAAAGAAAADIHRTATPGVKERTAAMAFASHKAESKAQSAANDSDPALESRGCNAGKGSSGIRKLRQHEGLISELGAPGLGERSGHLRTVTARISALQL